MLLFYVLDNFPRYNPMTNKQMLTDLIVSTNQSYLDEFNVTLTAKDLTFTDPTAGDFEGGTNTMVGVTADTQFVEGSYVYYYTRLDMQQAFADIGITLPSVQVESWNGAGLLIALKNKYNFVIHASEIESLTFKDDLFTIKVVGNSLIWTGELVVSIAEITIEELSVAFPNNVLNGLD
jgi:hypothetical protein